MPRQIGSDRLRSGLPRGRGCNGLHEACHLAGVRQPQRAKARPRVEGGGVRRAGARVQLQAARGCEDRGGIGRPHAAARQRPRQPRVGLPEARVAGQPLEPLLDGVRTSRGEHAREAETPQGLERRRTIGHLVEGAMEGLLEPELVEEPLGKVEVRAVFPVRKGTVAGCYVLSGKVTRNCRVRVMRGEQAVYEGNLDSLKRMKDDAKEVNAGFECGIAVGGFNDWKEGDIINAFKMISQRRTLAPA